MLKLLSEHLVHFIEHGDCIVDFSCGANEWVPIMKHICAQHGKFCTGKAIDIITPKDVQDFVQKSWFDVQPPLGTRPSAIQYRLEILNNLWVTRQLPTLSFGAHVVKLFGCLSSLVLISNLIKSIHSPFQRRLLPQDQHLTI